MVVAHTKKTSQADPELESENIGTRSKNCGTGGTPRTGIGNRRVSL